MGKNKEERNEDMSNQVFTLDDILGVAAEDSNDESEKKTKKNNLKPHNAIEFIPNPLPVPKRREHVAMDYAYEVSDDDDFDLTDITGMDFFDYE